MPPLEPIYPIDENMSNDEIYAIGTKIVDDMIIEDVYKLAYKYQSILLRHSLRARKKRASKHTKNKE